MESKVLFSKYQALGNAYLIIEPDQLSLPDVANFARRICDPRFGIGSDGLLLGPSASSKADFALNILNPDGSEAEKSGNGLRIFCRYLWDKKRVSKSAFSIETKGGIVRAQILEGGDGVQIEMGAVSFDSHLIPIPGAQRQVLDETLDIDGHVVRYSAATVGNPHCVLILDEISEELAKSLGPKLETHPTFANRTNVQFVKVVNRKQIDIEIWERGAGYTTASGTSSCAAAGVAHRLGLCDADLIVTMPGGTIAISFDREFNATMTGPVSPICEGQLVL
jgi:diaminopimelate epimerase